MTDQFRAMCAELTERLEWRLGGGPPEDTADAELLDRARALQDQPVAEGPTDEELEKLADPFSFVGEDGWTRCVYDEVGFARAVLARWGRPTPQPVALSDIGQEWRPCVKLPITVHVRDQRPGETHSSTREGITPLRSDDLIMRGVRGEEYPIGRDLFEQTYELLPTPESHYSP